MTKVMVDANAFRLMNEFENGDLEIEMPFSKLINPIWLRNEWNGT